MSITLNQLADSMIGMLGDRISSISLLIKSIRIEKEKPDDYEKAGNLGKYAVQTAKECGGINPIIIYQNADWRPQDGEGPSVETEGETDSS